MKWITRSIQMRLVMVVACGVAALLLSAQLAITQLNNQLASYNQLIERNVAQEKAIDQMNFNFKVQIQEWKNVLLRGADTAQREKYWRRFNDQYTTIETNGQALVNKLKPGRARQLVNDFLVAHRAAYKQYQSGYKHFIQANFDPTIGDQAVAGIDRQPTELLQQSTDVIAADVKEMAKSVREKSEQVSFWAQVATLLIGVIVLLGLWLLLRASLIRPLQRVANHIQVMAKGDFSQALQVKRADELGQLSDNLRHMQREISAVVSSVKNTSIQLSGASEGINQTASDIARHIGETETSTDQVAAAVNEMSSTVQEVATNASGAAESASDADKSTKTGLDVMAQTVDAINALSSQVEEVSHSMIQLEGETDRIGRVLGVIKDIAEQTNLLALNAAIEAARAGEQGRGFAVVADEVRSLAKRTQESTAEIQQIIEAVQSGAASASRAMSLGQEKTEKTVALVNQSSESIRAIGEAINAIVGMNTQIATAAEEQSYAAEEINQSTVKVVELVQQAHRSAQDSTKTANELEQTAQQLSKQVAHFVV